MAERYLNLRQIVDNIRDHPMLKDVPFERIVNYAVDFSRIMRVPQIFENKVVDIKIHNYVGELPCDFHNVVQMKDKKTNKTLVPATGSFFLSNNKVNYGPLTYRIQNEYLYTGMEEGIIELSYRAIKVDKDGYPLIPDNSMYALALEYYVKKRTFTKFFDMGKIPAAVLQQAQQDYAWIVGQCLSDYSVPTEEEFLNLANMWNSLIPKRHLDKSGYVDAGEEEHLKF